MIGLDISDRSIKVVELSDGKSQFLRTVCWSSLTPNLIRRGVVQDPKKVATAVQDALGKCSPVPAIGKTVVASIPETQSFVRVLDLPIMSDKEMDEAVNWAIKQHIPFDLDRVYLDWQILPKVSDKTDRQSVLIGAAQKDVVDPLLRVLDGIGLNVIALELESQAIVRSLLPRDSVDVANVLIIDLGATSTNIIFFDQGAIRFTTSIQRGGDDLTQHLAQKMKIQPSIAAEKKALVGVSINAQEQEVASTLREVALDLIRQIEQVSREVVSAVDRTGSIKAILLVGGASNLPGIKEVFGEVFLRIPIQLGNPWINLSMKKNQEKMPLALTDAVHFTTALGLALRRSKNA